ncbi:MAG: hypothetical protein GXP26_00910 [Planctomycetes bacterium]|nr:hypothetical protein [Planctomycetota bacterium]
MFDVSEVLVNFRGGRHVSLEIADSSPGPINLPLGSPRVGNSSYTLLAGNTTLPPKKFLDGSEAMQDPLATNLTRLRRAASLARIATVLLLLAMFIGTHIPIAASIQSHAGSTDKVAHIVAYLVLTIMALVSWELSIGELRPHHYFTVWLCGTVYGAFDEITQIPVGRTCDGLDWLADIVGIVIGLTIFRIARPLMYRFL